MVYVYAVTSRGQRRMAARGIAGEPLRRIRVNRMDVIVGDMRKGPRPTPANLRKHIAVVERIAAGHSAALPARFGTSANGDDEVASLIGARQRTLTEQLIAVRNRTQMTIRLVSGRQTREAGRDAQPDVESATSSRRGAPPVAPARTGTDYLQRRAAAARHVPGFDPIRDAVTRWVREERVERRDRVATVYHLIPRRSATAYREAVGRAAAAAGTRLIVSGPWAPYAFASF
jgi:hypothetical protein